MVLHISGICFVQIYTFSIYRANISAIFVVFIMQLVTNLRYAICFFCGIPVIYLIQISFFAAYLMLQIILTNFAYPLRRAGCGGDGKIVI